MESYNFLEEFLINNKLLHTKENPSYQGFQLKNFAKYKIIENKNPCIKMKMTDYFAQEYAIGCQGFGQQFMIEIYSNNITVLLGGARTYSNI